MKIYSLNLTKTNDSELESWFRKMSNERQQSVIRLQNSKKQKAKIVADHLCRTAISEFCGTSPDGIEFCISEKGKPFAKEVNAYFNISHSGDLVVCAVSDKEIGIDIEQIRPFNFRAAEKFTCPDELEYIRSEENGFFNIWTLKEAYFKCIGTGLGADIKNVSFKISGESIVCSENGFACSFLKIDDKYICSVCEKL